MSDTPYLDQLIGSSASNEETDRKQIGAPTTVVAPQAAPTFPEDFEAVEADEAYPILGNVTGIGAEIGTGLYLTKRLHRSQQFLKWARGAKAASAAAIVTPEPASTATGVVGFALSEAAIWGVSNVIGQGIRKSFGVQDNISAGEVLASSVFGVGLVTKGGQKLISLGDGLAQMKAWGKGNELFVQGAKSFVSGATLGIAETALRQEVQLLLNERENRDAVEYLIGGAAGGGFNTMFDVFSRTGKWGQAKAKQVTSRAKEALAKKADELEARAETVAPRARPKLRLEANRIRQSINLVDDLGQQLDTASEALNNPKPKEAPEAPEASATTATPKDAPEAAPAPNKFTEDIPSEDWLEGKIEDAVERGTNRYGVPRSGSQTGGFDTPVKLPLDKTKGLKGANGEEVVGLNQENVDKLAKELTEKGSFDNPVVVGVMHDGTPYVLEGNHRLAASQQAGIPVDVEVRYFDGGQRKAVDGWKPKDLDTPEPTPAPKTPEASPMQQLRDKYKRAIADQDKGKGALDVVELDANFRVASDDFSKRVDAMIADTSPENVASVSEIIDDYIEMDALDAQLRQKTGQMQHGHRKDAGEAKFTNEMSENRQTRQEALQGVREKLDTLKEDGGVDDIQKLADKIFGEPVEAPRPAKKTTPPKDGETTTTTETPKEPKAPKKTPKERAVARLQKRLDELRAIRSSTADELETPAKPKRAKSAEEKDLEDRIKFYTGETKELDDIVALNERIEVLSGLMRGESMEAIQAQIGLPAKLKPSYLKPKKIESELTRLKDTEKRLMKMLRRRQTDELLNDLKDVFDPENGQRSPMDRLLNKYLEERTDALLNQPSTVTTGLPSGLLQVMWRPTVGTARSAVKAVSPLDSDLKGVGMTQRMKFASADVIATFDQLMSFAISPLQTSAQVGRNLVDTAKAGGQSAFFYKDGNKIDMNEGATVGNATIRNTKKVDQAAMRVAANQQKGAITRTAMKMLASDPAAALFALAKGVRAAGRTGVGTFDEPFIMILKGRRVRADAYREAIKQQPSDLAAFIDDYIANATTVDKQGVKRFNYLDEKYKDGANEVRRGLFRRADLEADDYRVQTEEHVINFWGKLTSGDPTMGKFFLRFMQPIFTTPTIGLIQSGRNVAHSAPLPIPLTANVGQRAYSEVAKRVGKKGKISNIVSGRVNKEINDHEIEIERLKTEKKKEGLDPKEAQKLDDELAATEQQLKSAVAYRTEKLYDDIAHTALIGGMAAAAFEAGRLGLISGAGSFLERDQRNNGEFEKYRGLADKDSVGWSYLLGDPFRTVVALYADLGARSVLEEEGKLTEQQTWGNFITSTLEAYATDAVFSTSLRQVKDLAFGQAKSRIGALIDIGAGALLVPSWARNLLSFNDETYSVHEQGAEYDDIPDRAMQKALGNESENYRVDKLGRPLKRNERGPLNYVFRYAPEERASRMQAEEDVRNVLRADSFQHNLFPAFPKAPRINGVSIPLDKFTKGRKTLLTVFHEMANENDDFLHELGDLVTSEDWLDDYANYETTENPTDPEKPYNEGIKRLVDVRDKYIEQAKTQLQDPSSDAQFYRNKDGQTIHEYIESFSNPTEENNRTVLDLLKIQ